MLAIVLASLAAGELMALAGGGGGYGGGGGGGGFGGGGGGGSYGGSSDGDGGALVALIIMLLVHYPAIGWPLAIGGAVVGYFYLKNRARQHTAGTILAGNASREKRSEGSIEAELSASDPAFDAAALRRRLRDAFMRIQDAWSQQRLEAVRNFCSDGIITRWTLQLAEQRAHNYRDVVENLQIDSLRFVATSQDAHFQELTVAVSGSTSDYRVALDTGEAWPGADRGQQFFKEYWSFVRRRGAQSLAAGKPGLIEGNCPNCAGPLAAQQNVACQYCGAIVKSGTYDWVLAEITQPSEWRPRTTAAIPGASAMQARDPAWNAQHLEDACSVAFYRHRSTQRLGDPKPVAGSATPFFVERLQAVLKRHLDVGWVGATNADLAYPLPEKSYIAECAVGSVEVLAVRDHAPLPQSATANGSVAYQDDAGTDGVLIEVRWSGVQWFHVDAAGRRQPGRGAPTAPRRHAYYFTRAHAARSSLDTALTSAHCPSCGAPQVEDASATAGAVCVYCGSGLSDGQVDWTLSAVLPWADPFVRNFIDAAGAAATPPAGGMTIELGRQPGTTAADGDQILLWAVAVAQADGKVDRRERLALDALRQKLGCHPEVLAQAVADPEAELPQPADAAEAQRWLQKLCRIAWSDGTVDMSEREVLRRLGSHAGLLTYEVNKLISTTRTEALTAARAELRRHEAARGQ